MVAMGAISFEKVPELINLGVIDRERWKKTVVAIRQIKEWFIRPDEGGYKLEPIGQKPDKPNE